MKKFYFLIVLSFLAAKEASALHTKGGWMYYEYLGPGINDPAKFRYRIGFNQYMICDPSAGQLNDPINFTFYGGNSPYIFLQDVSVSINTNTNTQNCTQQACYPCIDFIPFICYKVINYETIVELAPSLNGYIIAYQRCCRISGLNNLSAPSDNIGATYAIKIPGLNEGIPNAHINASPQFIFNDTSIVCGNNPFSIDFTAIDPNGDSLVYSFCDAYNGATSFNPAPVTASNPPYAFVPYQSPYTGSQPLGAGVTINPVTGVISGIAPPAGEYVLSVCVGEYRNGIRFAESRKELHLRVADCNPVAATLDPSFVTCGDLTLSFSNQSDNITIQNWFWQFDDPASGTADSSNAQFPSHTFSTAGVYTIKLIVNRGLPCVDSTTQVVSVFPGFFPGFAPAAPFCIGSAVTFNDTTRTNYGTVSMWSWNFGDPATLADTSHLQNPAYVYNTPGSYTIKLIVANSKGCKDTILTPITVLANPALSLLPGDTAYCGLDSLQLTATGTGNFSWSPATNITGANTATPLVYPTAPTSYIVTLDASGCKSRDTVRVTPVLDLTNAIAASPPGICEGDTLTLTGSSNHPNVSWQWSPAATLSAPAAQSTNAFPVTATTYTLKTKWGANCIATATQNITVIPLAVPFAGTDTSFCSGQAGIQLQASGGTSYQWTPAAGLSNPAIANPIATPSVTTVYAVSVGVNGCSRRRADSVLVTVRTKPGLQMPADTLICVIDTLQLNAAGEGSFAWTPNYNINNTSVNNPLVSPDVPTMYRLRLTDIYGCYRDDSVLVNVKADVTVDAGNDTSICKTEGYTLTATGDAVSYTWSPNVALSSNVIRNPFANPQATTTYTVTANIGKCQRTSDVIIKVAPYPVAHAGPDPTVCIGFNSQLTAGGGSSYMWSPATFLSNPNISNPAVLQPTTTTQYIVSVTDTLGCNKVIKDTVVVIVIPRLHVNAGPQDTSIVEGEPLFLNATGALTYVWTPDTWLSNPNISNPVAMLENNFAYIVTGKDAAGCFGTDSISVTVYKFDPDMYVPTAFTPNGDGNNDVARPILIGMRSLRYFRIYNRFGQLVFSTTEMGKGWDGVFAGRPQDMATFVWYAEGVTYKGQVRKKKGYVVLIR
jgi:gliding motility-associated-like protein